MSRRKIDEAAVRAEIRAVVARSFGAEPASLSDDTVADDIDGWDSLGHATLVIRLQRVFNVELDRSAAFGARDLGALAALVFAALRRQNG